MLSHVALVKRTRRHIPEDGILHSHRREDLKSYTTNVVPSSPIPVILMMEAIHSSETSGLTKSHGVTSQKTTFFIRDAVRKLKLLDFKL
jgi:hypothetical protein